MRIHLFVCLVFFAATGQQRPTLATSDNQPNWIPHDGGYLSEQPHQEQHQDHQQPATNINHHGGDEQKAAHQTVDSMASAEQHKQQQQHQNIELNHSYNPIDGSANLFSTDAKPTSAEHQDQHAPVSSQSQPPVVQHQLQQPTNAAPMQQQQVKQVESKPSQQQQQQAVQIQQAAPMQPAPAKPLQSSSELQQLIDQALSKSQQQQQQLNMQQQPQLQQQQPQQPVTQMHPLPMQPQPQQVRQQQQQPQQNIAHYQPAQQQQAQPQPPQPQPQSPPQPQPQPRTQPPVNYQHYHPSSPLYIGHNPFIEILRPHSYADDNIVTLNLSHSHIYEIDSDAFVGQRFEHIDLSNNKLGLIHSRSFRIGPTHSRHHPYNPHASSNGSQIMAKPGTYPTRRPPPAHPKNVIIDFSHNPAIVALSGAFDHIDVPNCLLNFTNTTVELKFGAFKKYFKEHPGHIIDADSVDCCEQEWLLSYKHNFVARTYCVHDPTLFLSKVPQQTIIDSCIAHVTSGRGSMTIQEPGRIQQMAIAPRGHASGHSESQNNKTYLILGGTAMILTSLSIYIIFYMFSLKAALVVQMQHKS